jgi:hypothetical protein
MENVNGRPILWKWTTRLIWIGSIVFLQIAEYCRCLDGKTYRPFFSLYAGVILALVLWLCAFLMANRASKRYRR